MKKRMSFVITILVLASMCLSACGPAATAAGSNVSTLFIGLCSDLRQGALKLFGELPMPNTVIGRQVAGGAARPPAGMIAGLNATTGGHIDEAFLVAHLQGDCPGCGGLKAKASPLEGIHPDELRPYVAEEILNEDPFLALRASADEYIAQGVMNGTGGIADHLTGKITAVVKWENGRVITIDELKWKAFLENGGDIPSLATNELSARAQTLLARNAAAMPAFEQTAKALKFAEGQQIRRIVYTTKIDFASASLVDDSFVVTALPGMSAKNIGAELSYGATHAPLEGSEAMNFLIQSNSGEVAASIDILNQSPTLRALFQNDSWAGSVMAYRADAAATGKFITLRFANEGLPRLWSPIQGGSGAAADAMVVDSSLKIPASMSEAEMASAFAEAGIPAKRSVIAGALTKLEPFAGTALRIVGVVGDVVAVVYVVDAASNVAFAWGPTLPLDTVAMLPSADPNVLAKMQMVVPTQDGGLKTKYPYELSTGGSGMNMRQTLHNLEERLGRGDPAMFGLYLPNPELPSIPLVTDLAATALDVPTPLVVYYGAMGDTSPSHIIVVENVINGNKVTFKSNDSGANWVMEGDPSSLNWTVQSEQWPDVICTEQVTFDQADYFRLILTPTASLQK